MQKSGIIGIGLLILCTISLSYAQPKLPKLELNVDNPIVKMFIKKALEEYIPKVTGENEKVKDISFITKKKTEEFVDLKGTVIFQNPKAALGNGNYRFKLKMGNNLLKPKIYHLKLQVLRIWFIRFYRKVI
jgi:hypothetical protein